VSFFQKRRVAIVVNSLLVHAGVEQRTLELAQFLCARGFSVEVCALRQVGKIAPHFEAIGVPVRGVRAYEYLEETGGYRFRAAGLLRLWWFFVHGRFGVVFCVQPPSSLVARLALWPPLGRRIVAMERFLIGERSPRRLFLDRLLARWTTRIVCVSTLLKDELIERARIPADRIAVVENGVEIAPPHDSLAELRARLAGRFVFGCVATLEPRKRQRVILDALARMAGERPVLVLVGCGESEALLREQAQRLGIADDVIFAGETAHPHDYFRLFDAFVFPSVEEGFGTAWAEGMTHGLPVICADVRPMRDYLRHEENGLLFPADDADALAREMARVRDDAALRRHLGERAAAEAGERFNRDRQLARLVEIATG
jgi:L-malate glycosyltransferase